MEQRIHISNVENSPSMCFDTGLDPRSFARTKMSQSLIEQGYVVGPDGSHQEWRASGVCERNGYMRVFGSPFQGKRLDLLINDRAQSSKQTALEALACWIKAKLFLGDTRSALNPGASFIGTDGSVFFAPENLSNRCLFMEGSQLDTYNCPDLAGIDTAAFCAAVMLYRILTGVHPYPSAEVYQDMREGVFLPIQLATPNLNEKLAGLINSALLLPVAKKRTVNNAADILSGFLEILTNKENGINSVSLLFNTLPAEKKEQAEKEKKIFLLKQNSYIKTKRFVLRNKHLLIGISIGILFLLFVVVSTVQGNSNRPTTRGMSPAVVIKEYYEAFSSLNHPFMEACIMGADKSDIKAAANLFAIVRTRQAYEMTATPSIIQARIWRESGGELPSPNVFGVTDLSVDYMSGSEDSGLIIYRAEYMLWAPDENFARNRSDILTLRPDRHRNWRIIEIIRTER